MSTQQDTDLRSFPFPRQAPLDPPHELAVVRETEPISTVKLWDGTPALLATRYEDIRHVLRDPQISSDTSRDRFPQASETAVKFRGGQKVFVRMDSPAHDVHRMMLTKDFTVRHVREYRPYLDEMIDELFDEMERKGAPADLVEDFALVVPSRVITRILDLPPEDSEFFLDRVKTSMNLDSTPEQIAQSGKDTLDYFARVIEDRTGGSGDDLITRLVRQRVMTGELTSTELQHMLHLVLVGGFDTTANMIALGTLLFLQNPDQIEMLQGSPELLPTAVEEMLRYLSVAHHVAYRQAKGETELAGHRIEDGDAVVAPIQAANHDPDVFPSPEKFDITRDARGHLAFGYGIHQCLGQALARVELQAVFGKLFDRFPNIGLATDWESLVFRNSIIYGVEKLPVSW
jgi:cytochrome P450